MVIDRQQQFRQYSSDICIEKSQKNLYKAIAAHILQFDREKRRSLSAKRLSDPYSFWPF
jgi:hypothetical protein